jgi:hypothetical protein
MDIEKTVFYTDQESAQPYIDSSLKMGYIAIKQELTNLADMKWKVFYRLDAPHETVELLRSINGKLTFFTIILILALLGQIFIFLTN